MITSPNIGYRRETETIVEEEVSYEKTSRRNDWRGGEGEGLRDDRRRCGARQTSATQKRRQEPAGGNPQCDAC